MNTTLRRTMLASSVALTFGAPGAEAALVLNVMGYPDPNYGTPEQSFRGWSTDSANFTFLATYPAASGGVVGGTNDIAMAWDGNAYNSISDYTGPGGPANVTLSTTTPFFGMTWTAHDIQMFTPGSYSFDVTLGGGNPETGVLSGSVGAGQLGMHMLFDWNGNNNIDIFVVFAQNSIFGSGLLYSTQSYNGYQYTCSTGYTVATTKNCLYDGPIYGSAGAPVKNQVWMLASTDPDGDGVMGIPMASGGPFETFSINFNANLAPNPIPIPAAVWLFGSGLLGLVGVARHRKRN